MDAVCLCGFVCLLGIVMCIVGLAGMGFLGYVCLAYCVWFAPWVAWVCLRCVGLWGGLLCMVCCVTCGVYLCLVLLPCRLIAGLWLGICYCLWFL